MDSTKRSPLRTILIVCILILVGIAVWWLTRKPAEQVTETAAESSHSSRSLLNGPIGGPAAPTPSSSAQATRRARERLDEKMRARMIEALAQARATHDTAATPPSEGASASATPRPSRVLSKDYIRERIEEIKPLLAECYELGPTLPADMRATVEFTITGDPSVGGIVENVSNVDIGDTQAPSFIECMRETLYTLSFDPPENGGTVTVRFPFHFERTEEPENTPNKAMPMPPEPR